MKYIKKYNEDINWDFDDEEIDCIIGYPSGNIINLTVIDLNYLLKNEHIKWDKKLFEFTYYDARLNLILDLINDIRKDDTVEIKKTGFIGTINSVIENYQGYIESDDIINIEDMDYYFYGDVLYIVNINNKKMILSKEEISKIIPKNDKFI